MRKIFKTITVILLVMFTASHNVQSYVYNSMQSEEEIGRLF